VKEKGLGSPEGAPKSQSKPNQTEQSSHSGGIKTPERQPLPNVWDVLERKVRLRAFGSDRRDEKYDREWCELNRLVDEIDKKGTDREKLISNLYRELIWYPTGTLPVVASFTHLSPEEFKQFRSKVEPMADDEIREEIRKAKAEYKRKQDEINKDRGDDDPFGGFAMP
jgi:hypothetical protein